MRISPQSQDMSSLARSSRQDAGKRTNRTGKQSRRGAAPSGPSSLATCSKKDTWASARCNNIKCSFFTCHFYSPALGKRRLGGTLRRAEGFNVAVHPSPKSAMRGTANAGAGCTRKCEQRLRALPPPCPCPPKNMPMSAWCKNIINLSFF